jgi:hypothetical protein
VDISGNGVADTVDFTYGGSVTDTTGTTISIANQNGGTKDFNGDVSGAGVSLASNTGATMRFDGGLGLASGTANALSATGGGTLAVTNQNGGVNTLASTTGTALNVQNTTIHDDDLTFRSIASNGAANGVNVNTTSNQNGRLVVAGNGGTCSSAATCTGGGIQSSSGAGIVLSSVPGGASLTRMFVGGGGDDGIRATTVGTSGTATGLAIDSSVISGNGNAVDERGLDATNLLGYSSIGTSTVTGSASDNVRVANSSGISDLKVSGSTFSSTSTTTGNDGIQLYGDGSATMRSSILNSTFTANRDDALQVTTGGASDATMHTTFNNNTVNAGGNTGSSNNAAVVVSPAGTSDTFFHMNGGTIKGSQSSALILNPLGTAQFDATIENITIGAAAEAKSGSRDGIGLWAKPVQNSDAEIAIRNSTIQQYAQNGMYLRHNDGTTGVADYTVTGNTVTSPNPGLRGIYIESGRDVHRHPARVCGHRRRRRPGQQRLDRRRPGPGGHLRHQVPELDVPLPGPDEQHRRGHRELPGQPQRRQRRGGRVLRDRGRRGPGHGQQHALPAAQLAHCTTSLIEDQSPNNEGAANGRAFPFGDKADELQLRSERVGDVQRAALAHQPEPGALLAARDDVRR